jgi:hypothetical protein
MNEDSTSKLSLHEGAGVAVMSVTNATSLG